MGTDDKINNEADDLKGKAKEAVGNATGNDKLEAEGKGDQVEADVKKAGEHVKDAFEH
ncbi:MAG: CsbD family protein [Actinomycetota bacterium]|nr:CsbD family protein [Actinomycetota bacterium]